MTKFRNTSIRSIIAGIIFLITVPAFIGCATSKNTNDGTAEAPPQNNAGQSPNTASFGTPANASGLPPVPGAAIPQQPAPVQTPPPVQTPAPVQAAAPATPSRFEPTYRDIMGKRWQLTELRIGYGVTMLDRAKMAESGMDNIFILAFTADGLNGQAAPNRYFAPHEVQSGRQLSIKNIVGTLLAANMNVGGLMESEYYYYLQRINRWDLQRVDRWDGSPADDFLFLYSTLNPGEEVVLVYRPAAL